MLLSAEGLPHVIDIKIWIVCYKFFCTNMPTIVSAGLRIVVEVEMILSSCKTI